MWISKTVKLMLLNNLILTIGNKILKCNKIIIQQLLFPLPPAAEKNKTITKQLFRTILKLTCSFIGSTTDIFCHELRTIHLYPWEMQLVPGKRLLLTATTREQNYIISLVVLCDSFHFFRTNLPLACYSESRWKLKLIWTKRALNQRLLPGNCFNPFRRDCSQTGLEVITLHHIRC